MTGTTLIDTSALLALANPRDQYHSAAVMLAKRHVNAGGRFLGTVLVLGEFHAHLLYRAGTKRARTVVSDLLRDPLYSWSEVDVEIVASAVSAWMERFVDQKFSLIDAVSFEVMRRNKVTSAFAFNRHFCAAGFELLQ